MTVRVEERLASLARRAAAEREQAEKAAGPVEYRHHVEQARAIERRLLALIRAHPAKAELLFHLRKIS